MEKLSLKIYIKLLFALSPYIGVILGLYILKNAFFSIFIYHIGLISAFIVFRKDIDFKELLLIKNKILFIIILLLFSISGIFIYFLWDLIKLPELNLQTKLAEFDLSGINQILFLIYFSTVHSFLEEIYWRFILNFKNKYVSISEILFSLYHFFVIILFIRIEYAVFCTLSLIVIGRLYRYFHDDLKENLTVFISHAAADFSIFLFVILINMVH